MKKRFFTDPEGYDSVFLDPDDKEDFGLDCTRWVPSGAVLSSATVESEDGGVTISGTLVSGNVVSFFLSALTANPAEVTIQFTFSNGVKRSHTIRAYEREH